MLLGVDVGGTFTDAVLHDGERLHTAKAPTTPEDQSAGVLAAVALVLSSAGREGAEVGRFAHGMTVATNALLEGRGARTALVTTDGFQDLVELGRQNRPELYRLCASRPAPLVPRDRRFGAPERMGPEGPLRSLDMAAARDVARKVAEAGPEAVAVSLLHSYRHPRHEQMLARALGEALPGVHVSLSHEVVGAFREFERTATTEVDASLSPLLARYLQRLAAAADDAGLPEPAIMQSNGGLIDAAAAASHASWTVLSGPAGGAAAAASVARAAGVQRALCFDMGGTSCDICVIDGGQVQERTEGEVAGRPLALPMLAIHTVGAGGGSVAWADAGGALRVGPRSAGAVPGPACYRRGGREPTVTDADLVLGRLDAERPLAGGLRPSLDAARQAIAELASSLGMDVEGCAEGIVRVADAEMVRALRVVTVERGIDPREYSLLCFGGAGPLHAAAVAEELGIDEVVCPLDSGVLSALGLATGSRRRDARRSVFLSGAALTGEALAACSDELGQQAREALGADGELRAVWELRYRGQGYELAVEDGLQPAPATLQERFDSVHESRYGFRDPEGELELVSVRVSAVEAGPQVSLPDPGIAPVDGPCLLALRDSTLVVPAGWRAEGAAGAVVRMRRR